MILVILVIFANLLLQCHTCCVHNSSLITCFIHVVLQLQSIVNDLEENKDLASSRLNDLEKLQEKYQDVVKELEQSKMNVSLFLSFVLFMIFFCEGYFVQETLGTLLIIPQILQKSLFHNISIVRFNVIQLQGNYNLNPTDLSPHMYTCMHE